MLLNTQNKQGEEKNRFLVTITVTKCSGGKEILEKIGVLFCFGFFFLRNAVVSIDFWGFLVLSCYWSLVSSQLDLAA